MTRSSTQTLAQYATSTSIEAIPSAVKERARQVIFDEMACAYFGRRSTAGELAVRYAASVNGPTEARILGTPLRAPAAFAALANGMAGHGEEVDGTHFVGGHPGASIVHAAVAVAERQRASGAELLNAVVLGYDVGVRLVEACGGVFGLKNRHHVISDFMNAVAAAVAASRILGLDATRHCYAMALSTFQANGLWAVFHEKRHVSKSFARGQYAFAGVSAALMAASGFEAVEDVLGAPAGVLAAWGGEGGEAALTRGLGRDYAVMGANFKFLNTGYPIHAPVEAAMALVGDHGIGVDAIESVHVGMPENARRLVDDRPMYNVCLQDMLSVALLRGGLRIGESYFPAILGDPAFARMRARITVGVDAELNREQPDGRGANVTIVTVDGSTVSMRVEHPRGNSLARAVTWSDLSEKWRDALGEREVEGMIAVAQGLEHLEDTAVLADAFKADTS
jgi:2-methylcitrate dehydratase PrpD